MQHFKPLRKERKNNFGPREEDGKGMFVRQRTVKRIESAREREEKIRSLRDQLEMHESGIIPSSDSDTSSLLYLVRMKGKRKKFFGFVRGKTGILSMRFVSLMHSDW